jgi:tellurite resistance protein TehA-like permease
MAQLRPRGLVHRIGGAAEHLYPGYFALVMATGIVSIAAHTLDLRRVAAVLLAINVASYATLGLLLAIRVVRYPRRVLEDLDDHGRGPGFFTVVAGTCVLGTSS